MAKEAEKKKSTKTSSKAAAKKLSAKTNVKKPSSKVTAKKSANKPATSHKKTVATSAKAAKKPAKAIKKTVAANKKNAVSKTKSAKKTAATSKPADTKAKAVKKAASTRKKAASTKKNAASTGKNAASTTKKTKTPNIKAAKKSKPSKNAAKPTKTGKITANKASSKNKNVTSVEDKIKKNSKRKFKINLGKRIAKIKKNIKKDKVKKVAFLTAGGLAPCLSSSIGFLIEEYNAINPNIQMIGYINGYKGLLLGDSIKVTKTVRKKANVLTQHGGSPLGNSRVKLTNIDDCVKRGLVQAGQDPLKVAADQLIADGVDVLHTIGGDDTSLTAADLAAFLKENDYNLTVVGLPKTIDNDVYPIHQSFGAWTAAEEGAKYFANVVKENSANPRMFIIHEVMGRNCGYLTAQTAIEYRRILNKTTFLPAFNLTRARQEVHAVYIPEMKIDIEKEAARLKKIMDKNDCVNIFVSEGACVEEIIQEMKRDGKKIPMDAFGHPRLDKVNPGEWFASKFADLIGAEKTLVQKTGYYSRAAAPCKKDLELIQKCCKIAVKSALARQGGVVGQDENKNNEIRACEFNRIAGGKPYDVRDKNFKKLLKDIGQK